MPFEWVQKLIESATLLLLDIYFVTVIVICGYVWLM